MMDDGGGVPEAGDLLIAQIDELGHHSRLDLNSGTKCTLYPGDVVAVSFAARYATKVMEAEIPDSLEEIHFLSAGGVCGRVLGMANDANEPTTLHPLGYLCEGGKRINLRTYALPQRPPAPHEASVIIVVGSAMDSGKTTAAFSLVHGLTNAGIRTGAAKITGTATAKDPRGMWDAGASLVYDFTHMGYGSTAGLTPDELSNIAETIIANLAHDGARAIVIEIADGITQRETDLLLHHFAARGVAGVVYTCNDSMGVPSGLDRLTSMGHRVLAISGSMTRTELAAREAQSETHVPVLTREQLRDPSVVDSLGLTGSGTRASNNGTHNGVHPTYRNDASGVVTRTWGRDRREQLSNQGDER